jgi:saccharopine dehydrogenase (NADP+, L-glutamate forming)
VLAAKHPNTQAIALNAIDIRSIHDLGSKHDVVISLLPYINHPAVIVAAVAEYTHSFATSYTSDAICNLKVFTEWADITVLNEIVVDPGVDHVYVIKRIDKVYAKGHKALEFCLYCGGLPAQDCAGTALGFNYS